MDNVGEGWKSWLDEEGMRKTRIVQRQINVETDEEEGEKMREATKGREREEGMNRCSSGYEKNGRKMENRGKHYQIDRESEEARKRMWQNRNERR